MQQYQNTLVGKIVISGKALHSGRMVTMELLPSGPSSGIIFQRTDSSDAMPLLAHAMNITATDLCTTIGHGASTVATIEHLMAAFYGLGIDNALVKVNAPEVPILDGSARPFIDKITKIGIAKQNVKRRVFVVKKAFEVRQGDRYFRVRPAARTSISCSIDFANSMIGHQSVSFTYNQRQFLEFSSARTFCHINDVVAMRQAGLALGGSLHNAVVISDTGIMNEEGLRFNDEFVKHKLVDCIGDLALLGAPLLGNITVHKPGHTLHAEFMNKLLQNRSEYLTIIEPGKFSDAALVDEPALASAMYG